MATQRQRLAGRVLVAPSVILLFLWMIVPLAMTIYFSTLRYNLLDPDNVALHRSPELPRLSPRPDFFAALFNTLVLVGCVLVISVVRRHFRRAADGPADLRARTSCA